MKPHSLASRQLWNVHPGSLMMWAALLPLMAGGGCADTHKEGPMSQKQSPAKFVLSPAPEYQPLLTGKPQTHGMRAGRVVLSDNGCNERHTTGNHEETLVFLAGSGQVRFEGHEPIAAKAGDVVYIPPNTTHQVCADAGVELRYVYVVAPIGQ
jgi:quercetin dioxygenase-like cupin family protein